MFKFILVILAALAAFWCYNNLDMSMFSADNVKKNAISSMQNEKTVKAVTEKRAFDRSEEQAAMEY